ncbi:MAG: L-arabinose transport system permease protein AraQ [Firmicutes bacterium ADurb.Bin506]|jgi:multiple sugar transport system permease protein|nr:MAG: L-arabinose transport system permease protein AraQ [Firmicutes bacterium ADurb.Bin506]
MAARGQAARRIKISELATYAALAIGALAVAMPFLYAISTSLKDPFEVFEIPMKWIPAVAHWENYVKPFKTMGLARNFLNSVIVAVSVTTLNVFTCSMAGYSFAKFRYWGRDFFFLAVLATLMVPLQVILVPLFELVKRFGWINTYRGLIIPAGTSAFGVFLMRQYFLTVPSELMEAARIDGCSETGIFFRIMLPLVKPALSTLVIFIFMNNWNSFLWPLLAVTREEMMTLPLGIASFESTYSTNYPQLMAVSMASTLPVLIVFFTMQRQFIEGMALSGMKS